MTREEAKHLMIKLRDILTDEGLHYAQHYVDAYDMAIKALEQEPICPSHGIDCEDCPAYDPRVDTIIREEVKRIIMEGINNEV